MMEKEVKRIVAGILSLSLILNIPVFQGQNSILQVAKTAEAVGYGINNPTIDNEGVTTWDCVWFGNYWQNDTNGDGVADQNDNKEPIKWRVLSVDGNDAFLLADQNLDCQPYNETDIDVTWETCTLRSWLNGYSSSSNITEKDYGRDNFIDEAFSEEEQSAICPILVTNNATSYEMEGGNDTCDQVYLLSDIEAKKIIIWFSDYRYCGK